MLVAKKDPIFNKDLLGLARKKKRWWGWLMNEDNTYESDSGSDNGNIPQNILDLLPDPFEEQVEEYIPQIAPNLLGVIGNKRRPRPVKRPNPPRRRPQKFSNDFVNNPPAPFSDDESDFSQEEKESETNNPSDLNTNPYLPVLNTELNNNNNIKSKPSKKKVKLQSKQKIPKRKQRGLKQRKIGYL